MSGRETPIPDRIGRYEIVGSLGTGSMGAVYKGFDPLIKRTLAIKTIRLDLPRDSLEYRTFLERFYQEARISGTLSHPGIVTLYDIGEEEGVPFLAMEHIDGETLESALGRGARFPAARGVALIAQIAAALDYAHSRDVVHRDVKPANLLVFDGDRVKITDFGIAKLANTSLTKVGQLLGTPAYMSPEQASGESLDGRSDIFSLGVCAFELLSGVQPFVGEAVTDILYNLVNAPPQQPPDLEARGLVPPRWHEVFGRVLAKRREQRHQTGAEFARELELCLAEPGAGTATDTRPPGFVPAPAPPPVRTIPPRVARKDATTPPGGVRAVDADAPTIVIGSDEVASGPETVRERAPADEEVPETIALSADQVSQLAGASRSTGGDRPAAEEPTILMPGSELELPPTQKIGRDEARELVGDVGGLPTERYAAIEDTISLGEPPPTVPDQPRPAPRPASKGVWVGAGLAAALVALLLVGLWLLRGGAPASASVAIVTEPAGASVTVDGELRGTAPVALELAPGAHEVRASLEGYLDAVQPLEVAAGGSGQELRLELRSAAPTTALAAFASEPPGASVTIDGRPVGETPLEGVELEPGEHEVTMARSGYRSWSGSLSVEAGETPRISRELQAVPQVTPSPEPTAVAQTTPVPGLEEEEQAVAETPTPVPTPTPIDTSRVYFDDQVDEKPTKVSGEISERPKLEEGESVSVTVSWVVDEEGRVSDIRVVESGGEAWDRAVVEALEEWRFRPGKIRDVAVKVQLMRKYTFR